MSDCEVLVNWLCAVHTRKQRASVREENASMYADQPDGVIVDLQKGVCGHQMSSGDSKPC